MSDELAGRRILVVGGGSGIGLATVQLAAVRGARLAVSVLTEAERVALLASLSTTLALTGEATTQQGLLIERAGGALLTEQPGVAAAVLDLTARATVGPVLAGLIDQLGGLDALVYCAGIPLRTAFAAMTDAQWDQLFEINLTGGMRVLREVLPALTASPNTPGAVIISSQLGTVGFRTGAAYSASKWALNGLVASVALEYGPLGVRVNAVGPGPTETPLTEESRADPAILAEMVGAIPMGRYGLPPEIAEVILFLASARASFVTGQCWCVDGGYTAK